MRLRYCAFTGTDDAVDPTALAEISRQYPFVEWAIACSPAEAGSSRYPTPKWVTEFHQACPDVNKATHLCRDALRGFMSGHDTILKHIEAFPRVQLNFGFDFGDVSKVDASVLARQIIARPNQQFILQYNDCTKHLLNDAPNLAILFDASAGTGVKPDRWPAPFSGRLCGYAGGMGPDNIGQTVDQLLTVVPPLRKTWIDMETLVRTDGRFDLSKVRTVLEIVKLSAAQPSFKGRPKLEFALS